MNTMIRAGLAALAIAAVPVAALAQDVGNSEYGSTTTTRSDDDGFDLGWLGLIGLAGLLGLRRKEPTVHHTSTERVAPRV